MTTQNLSVAQLQVLSDEVGAEQTLLICCAAFREVTAGQAAVRWPNLTLKKITKMALFRCEWSKDDYSLNVVNLPVGKQTEPVGGAAVGCKPGGRKKADMAMPDMFGNLEQGGDDGEEV